MRRSSQPDIADPELAAAVARVHDADVAEEVAEAKAAFHLRMRSRGIRDLAVLRAFELVPRQNFVPHRYLDLAARDLALPIGCGQTLPEPWLVARMFEALRVEGHHRVLEIGSGTGFATTILSHLASEVIGLERFRSLAVGAEERLRALAIDNAAVIWGDGLAIPEDVEPFDRIVVHGLVANPGSLLARLVEDGRLVCACADEAGEPLLMVFARKGDRIETSAFGPCRLPPILPGLAATL